MARQTLEEVFSDVMLLADSMGATRTMESTITQRAAFFAGAQIVLQMATNMSVSLDERAAGLAEMLVEVAREYNRWLAAVGPDVAEEISRRQRGE